MEKKIITITGQRGSGKSTLAKNLVKDKSRLFIFDTLGGEYTPYGVVITNLQDLANFWYTRTETNFRIVYQPLNPVEEFPIICDLIYSCGDLCFHVEEIDTFLSNNTSGLDREFLNIVQRGRHKNIEMIGVTQRPYSIPPILRSQTKIFYAFRQIEDRDINYLRNVFGDQAYQIRDLKTFEYIKEEDGQIEMGTTTYKTL